MQENKQKQPIYMVSAVAKKLLPKDLSFLHVTLGRYPRACAVTHRKLGASELGGVAEPPPC